MTPNNNSQFIRRKDARRVGIIGAGPGGISFAHAFKSAGYDNIVMWERGDDVGGTWFHNRYPGLQCDVASHLYSFSFDLNPRWSRTFAPQPEILAYMKRVVDRQDIRRHVKLGTEVQSATWDDERLKWRVVLSSGAEETVDILCSAQGMFGAPRWPDVPGMDSFKGDLLHTARWPEGLSLAGKRVAVIGTAATTVQMLPTIAPIAAQVDVYQRTPVWVMTKNDPVFDEETLEARANDPALSRAERLRLFRELDDFVRWTERTDDSDMIADCKRNLEFVKDPELRAKLTPSFNWGCARPLFSNDYYPAFNRENVSLITDSVAQFVPDGIIDAQGQRRQYDVIICATGYHVDKFLSAIPVTGVGGLTIDEAWSDGPKAYKGITTAGFPNLFMSYGPNTNNGSLIAMGEYEAAYVVRHVEWMDANDVSAISIRPEAEFKYNEDLQANISSSVLWNKSCHSYYFGASGRNITQYPLNMTAFRQSIMAPDWDDYQVEYGSNL